MLIFVIYFWATSSEKVSSNLYKMHRFRLYRAKSPPGTCSLYIHSIVSNDSVKDSKGRDQTAQMLMLIWVFAVHICPKTHFRMTWPF